MATDDPKTAVLGAEYDALLRRSLVEALAALGGSIQEGEWNVAGSQEREVFTVKVGARHVVVEAETYIGLSITGDADLVDRIQTIVRGRAAVKSTGESKAEPDPE